MDEEYTQSDISKEVERLMDEEGFEFGEAVKEAMSRGYKDGGLMIAIQNLAQGGMTYGDKTYHQYHDQYVPPDSENMMYANGGGIGSMMIPKRQGLFMGGSPLTGESLAIYNSMNAYGYTDQEIADRLSGLGLYDPNATTPPPTTPPPTTPPSGGGGGGGEGDGPVSIFDIKNKKNRDTLIDMGIKAADDDKGSLMLDETISKTTPGLEISDRNRGMEDNEDFIDRGNPKNDSRVVSEEMGLVGGITDRNRGQITSTPKGGITTIDRPNMRDIAGPSTTVDESISIEDLSKPSNIGDFQITGAPDLTNQTGILNAPPSIGLAQDPDVEDPFGGKYSPSFEEKKAAEGILEGLLDKAANFDLSDLQTMGTNFSINKALQTLGFSDPLSFLGTMGIGKFKNMQVKKEIEKQAAIAQNRKETREIQARIDAAEKKRKDDIAKKAATAAAKKAASEGRAYDYSGRSNKQGTHTSTISKEKAADNRESKRGNTGSNKSSNKSSNTGTKSGGGGKGGGADSGGRSSSGTGGGWGGSATGGGWCFDPNTFVQMADGSEKKIKEIQLGDSTKGGEVTGVFQFKAADEIHDYKGVTVAGSHYVKEDGRFIMVKDSPLAVKINKIPVVYSLDTSGRRIFINDIEFADYNGDGIAKGFLSNAGVDLTGFDTEVLRQVEHRLI